MNASLIIVAAGAGKRFGEPKWKVKLAGNTLLEWQLNLARRLPIIQQVVVVAAEDQIPDISELLNDWSELNIALVAGGQERFHSVEKGLKLCDQEFVFVHNVANPLASEADFFQLAELVTAEDVAAFAGQPVVDTLRRVDEKGAQTVDRSNTWRVQTPQAFRTETLRQAFREHAGEHITDDVSLFENSPLPVRVVETSAQNTKLTFPEDLELMERNLHQDILVGIGEDSHAFDDTGEMMIGGLKVAHLPKLKGNSDGDLILHAIFNAVSSALGKRSIGPTADPMAAKGITDSAEYVQVVLQQAEEAGYQLKNVSISLECLRPKIEPIADEMKSVLSDLLKLSPSRIGITATTGEGMGDRAKEAVFCRCVVNLISLS